MEQSGHHRYDLRQIGERYERSIRRPALRWGYAGVGAGIGVIALAFYILLSPPYGPTDVVRAEGWIVAALGALLIAISIWGNSLMAPAAEYLEVGSGGLTLTGPGTRQLIQFWADPKLNLQLIDYRNLTSGFRATYPPGIEFLLCDGLRRVCALPLEAAKMLVEVSTRQGLSVTGSLPSTPEKAGVPRTVRIRGVIRR